MIIVPREKAVIVNLNSYYLDIKKVFEHYQGEIGSGAIHFKSPSEEGIVFFDKDDLLNGVLKNKKEEVYGNAAIKRLLSGAGGNSFTINIYEIDPDKVYLWANIPNAKKIYKDLSSEFTDLDGLIKKMESEKLTGYIDVSINNGKGGGLIFYNNGEIIGGSYSWGKGELNGSDESRELIIEKTKELGGVFHVSRISLAKKEKASEPPREIKEEPSSNVLTALEELLVIFEGMIMSNKKIKADFSTLLKKKFVEKADKYAFLDPFAGEFEYSKHNISFSGDAGDEDVINAVIESVEDLAGELGILPRLVDELAPWSQKYAKEVARFGISY